MVQIRAITLFCEADFSLAAAAGFFAASEHGFEVAVQSRRVALPPFPTWWDAGYPAGEQAQAVAGRWQGCGAHYISLGPVQLGHDPAWLELLPTILNRSGVLFASAEIANTIGELDTGRCAAVAQLVQKVSRLQANGFGNLYLAAIANCPAGSPFFPVAYHRGGPAGFALAVEAGGLALQAIQQANSLSQARTNLVTAIEQAATSLTAAAQHLAAAHDLPFWGIDFSLAPFPTADKSLAGAIEALGLPWLGSSGSLFAAAFITEAIGRASFQRTGFSGLMLSVLEDSVLAERAGSGRVTLHDLLCYSAVCGVGLDTIPLPGDIEPASLTAILLDVAVLATRLNKPLTARLMPLPGLAAGDPVLFDFPYFADSRVMAPAGQPISGLLAQSSRLQLNKLNL